MIVLYKIVASSLPRSLHLTPHTSHLTPHTSHQPGESPESAGRPAVTERLRSTSVLSVFFSQAFRHQITQSGTSDIPLSWSCKYWLNSENIFKAYYRVKLYVLSLQVLSKLDCRQSDNFTKNLHFKKFHRAADLNQFTFICKKNFCLVFQYWVALSRKVQRIWEEPPSIFPSLSSLLIVSFNYFVGRQNESHDSKYWLDLPLASLTHTGPFLTSANKLCTSPSVGPVFSNDANLAKQLNDGTTFSINW